MVGEEGKAAAGCYWGVVMKRAPPCATCTGTDEGMNDVMGEMTIPCLVRTSVHLM